MRDWILCLIYINEFCCCRVSSTTGWGGIGLLGDWDCCEDMFKSWFDWFWLFWFCDWFEVNRLVDGWGLFWNILEFGRGDLLLLNIFCICVDWVKEKSRFQMKIKYTIE